MLLLASCGRPYSVDCGPLDPTTCLERADEIVSAIAERFPDRDIRSIEMNGDGAQVVLDDESIVGYGFDGRLSGAAD